MERRGKWVAFVKITMCGNVGVEICNFKEDEL